MRNLTPAQIEDDSLDYYPYAPDRNPGGLIGTIVLIILVLAIIAVLAVMMFGISNAAASTNGWYGGFAGGW